jgi:hypothetical protein
MLPASEVAAETLWDAPAVVQDASALEHKAAVKAQGTGNDEGVTHGRG